MYYQNGVLECDTMMACVEDLCMALFSSGFGLANAGERGVLKFDPWCPHTAEKAEIPSLVSANHSILYDKWACPRRASGESSNPFKISY